MKKCTKCGIEKELSQFTKDKSNKDGLARRCKACVTIGGKQWYENNKERAKEASKQWYENNKGRRSSYEAVYYRTTEGRYVQLKGSAKRRDLEMQISFEQYAELIKDNKCYYCDASLVGSAGYSLNRVDSNKGYLVENVKPCCKFCNKIMNNFSIEELSSRLYKIVNRMKKLQEENK